MQCHIWVAVALDLGRHLIGATGFHTRSPHWGGLTPTPTLTRDTGTLEGSGSVAHAGAAHPHLFWLREVPPLHSLSVRARPPVPSWDPRGEVSLHCDPELGGSLGG